MALQHILWQEASPLMSAEDLGSKEFDLVKINVRRHGDYADDPELYHKTFEGYFVFEDADVGFTLRYSDPLGKTKSAKFGPRDLGRIVAFGTYLD